MAQYIWQEAGFPAFTWSDELLRAPLEAVLAARRHLYGQLDRLALDEAVEPLIEETMTSAIEAARLLRRDVRASVARRSGLDSAGVAPAPRAVEGLVELVLDATSRAAEPVTVQRLWGWQAALFPTGSAGSRVNVGAWRAAEMEIVYDVADRLPHVHFTAPPPETLDHEIARLLRWLEGPARAQPGALAAGIAHLWFETLHPFDDGNGRVGRALVELVLARDDGRPRRAYSLSAQILRERDDYYRQLETAQHGGLDVTPWLLWFCGCLERALQHAIGELGTVWRRARFWRRVGDLGNVRPRQRRVLDHLLEAGPEGFAGGLSNRSYCHMANVASATAVRDLADLVKRGLLSRSGGGRGTRYALVWQLAAEDEL